MKIYEKLKRNRVVFLAAVVALVWIAFAIGANRCGHAEVVKVERDTVIVHDTIVDIAPTPKDSVRIRYVTRWLPAKRDTSRKECSKNKISVNSVSFSVNSPQDSVAVEVPITSKHYGCKDYDAWVSGYEPSLDSIKVYQRTEYITERVTISKPPNKWELDAVAGIDYNVTSQRYTPYAGGELLYKPSRFQFGIRGGVSKMENTGKFQPSIGGVVKMRIF